jgi:hypothetical protein
MAAGSVDGSSRNTLSFVYVLVVRLSKESQLFFKSLYGMFEWRRAVRWPKSMILLATEVYKVFVKFFMFVFTSAMSKGVYLQWHMFR